MSAASVLLMAVLSAFRLLALAETALGGTTVGVTTLGQTSIGGTTLGATALGATTLDGKALGVTSVGETARAGHVVFSSDRSGAWRTWIVKADGSELRQLTKQEGDEQDVDPSFSHDGKQILFTSTRGGHAGVWRMQLDGSNPERICDGDQAEGSPDGTQIAFRRDERILTRDLSSGKEKRVSPEGWPHCSGPSWSPDGKSIAFAARWEGGNAIFIVPPEGGKPTKVYDKEGACEPHWSPDGTRIVYETETHICTINRDGTKNRVITYFGGVQRYARYSPDGKHLVFCQGVSERGPWGLYIIPATGGTPQKLTEGSSDMYPDWR